MAADRAAVAAGETRRQTLRGRAACGVERDFLSC